jgi:hypothetical protein
VKELIQSLSAEVREDFEERAGIMEFDGRTSRELAEALALLDVLKRRPAALLDIDVFSVTQDRITKYLICRRGRMTAERLRSVGYEAVKEVELSTTLWVHFNGLAMLSRPWSHKD